MNRPHLCPDESCRLIRTDYAKDKFDEGVSYTCCGKMEKPHIFYEKKTEHLNPYSFCIYTPLKGHIRFFYCFGDAWNDFLTMAAIMDDKEVLTCQECGPVRRIGETVTHFRDEAVLCNKCAVRLGRLKWHPNEKRYY